MNLYIGGENIHYSIKRQTDRNHITRTYYRALITIRRDPDTGKLIRKEITAPSEEKLRMKLLEIQHIRPLESDSDLTLEMYLKKWIDQNSFAYSPNSIRNLHQYSRYMIKAIGHYRLWQLNEEIMRSFYDQLMQERGTCTSLKTRQVLSRAFSDAVTDHLMYANPQASVHIPKYQQKAIIPLTGEEASKLIELCRQDTVYGGIIACSLLLGLRISEATGLSITDYNPDTNIIRIHRQIIEVSSQYILENHTKNRSERILHPSSLAVEFLQRQLSLQKAYKEKSGNQWDNTYNCLFTNEKGHFLIHSTTRQHLKKMCQSFGREDFKFHHLRHTCATIVHNQPDGITIARDILGHKYFETTSTYIHSTPEQQLSALECVASFVKNQSDS